MPHKHSWTNFDMWYTESLKYVTVNSGVYGNSTGYVNENNVKAFIYPNTIDNIIITYLSVF